MSILAEIIEHKRVEVAAAKERMPQLLLEQEVAAVAPPMSLEEALRQLGLRVIAECKKQSPSKGIICPDYDPVELACSYERGGAAAISVLTDNRYFGGSLADLKRVRETVHLPILRKDFIIDSYQIFEARAAGADSFLLLAGVLDRAELQYFIEIGRELGMEALVESHTEVDLEEALATDAKILGINSRNLNIFSVDLTKSASMLAAYRDRFHERTLVCESGIEDIEQIREMLAVGFEGFLIGETLARADDPEALLKTWCQKIANG